MRAGKIAQHGTPEEVYEHPVSPTVAMSTGDALVLAGVRYPDGRTSSAVHPLTGETISGEIGEVVIRPEELHLSTSASSNSVEGTVVKIDYYGHDAMVTLEIQGQSIKVRIPGPFDYSVGEEVSLEHAGPVRFFAKAQL